MNIPENVNYIDAEIIAAANEIIKYSPSKVVISNKRTSGGGSASCATDGHVYEKIIITQKKVKNDVVYQAEQFTKTQVFHNNLNNNEISDYIVHMLTERFRQVDVFSDICDMNIKISKKGKVMISRKRKSVPLPTACVPNVTSHNRKKKRLIEEGTVIEPLIDMGIFTREGHVVNRMGDKFRQINRFLEIVDDAVNACGFKEITIVDFGCGKAYLTFILYYYLTYVKKIKAVMVGLDLKEEVIRHCNEAAERYGYENLHFEVGDISEYSADGNIDMVITLHACDTATDYALYNAIKWNTQVILSVPCCQHEINTGIKTDKLRGMTKYGIIKERFAALATDSIRASLLEYMGYKTQVLEFVDLSHTPKNLLIRALKTNIPHSKRKRSLAEAQEILDTLGTGQTLYNLLINEIREEI